MKNLDQIQEEVSGWSVNQFGTNISNDHNSCHYGNTLGSIPSFFGLVEELGELARVFGRCAQGRSEHKTHQEIYDAKVDAIADLMIFLCDLASRENIHLLSALNMTWNRVQNRRQSTWHEDKEREAVYDQNGQGWAEPPVEDS